MVAPTKWSQSEILLKLGIPRSQWWEFGANQRAQQFINQAAAAKGLPEPFNPSLASAIIQDVLPLAVIGGAAAAAGDTGAAAAGGAEGATAGGAAAGAAEAVGSALTSAAVLARIWDALRTPANWLRALEILGGVILVYMALKSLAEGSTPSSAVAAKVAEL